MIKFALMGCGKIAKRHAFLLGNSLINGAKLVAVCDLDLNRAKEMINEFENVNAYDDLDKMMTSEDVDVLVILTPSGMHSRHTIEASKYKAHIVVEKPMALTLKDADQMINVCKNNDIRLFVIKQNRFNLPIIALKEAINQGRFGKLNIGTIRVRWSRNQEYYNQDAWRGTWLMDGGVLTNQASHHLDLLEWLMGDVESVFAKTKTALFDIETEDTAIALLNFKNGAFGTIEASTAIRPNDLEGSISILGEYGSVEIGGFSANELKIWNFSKKLDIDKTIFKKFGSNPKDINGYAHKKYYDNIVESIAFKKSNLVDGEEGRKSLELINAIYSSAQNKKEIFLKDKIQNSKLGKNES